MAVTRKRKSHYASNAMEIQNAAKTLYANIRFMSPDNPIKTLLITSAVPNEGKTTTIIELGRAIATSGKTVLLVEADMRRRSLSSTLGRHAPAGIYSVLRGDVKLKDAIVATPVKGMYLLDSEPNIPNPVDVISSRRYRHLAEQLTSGFDYVLYDTPPVGTFVDAAVLSTLVDGVVLVVRMNQTHRDELQAAYDQLQNAGSNILGICATFTENTSSEYYYAYYNERGERVSKRELKQESMFGGRSIPAIFSQSDDSSSSQQEGSGQAASREYSAPGVASSVPQTVDYSSVSGSDGGSAPLPQRRTASASAHRTRHDVVSIPSFSDDEA